MERARDLTMFILIIMGMLLIILSAFVENVNVSPLLSAMFVVMAFTTWTERYQKGNINK